MSGKRSSRQGLADAAWELLDSVLAKWQECGWRDATNGARLICPMPEIAPQAWMHSVYPPLKPSQIKDLEAALGRPIPPGLREFYGRFHGCHLFSFLEELAIYGWAPVVYREGDKAWIPWSITVLNHKNERFRGCPPEYFFFGSCRGQARLVFPDPSKDNTVMLVDHATGQQYTEWPGFWECLLDEIKRLDQAFEDTRKELANRSL